jgi:hypothetical protein
MKGSRTFILALVATFALVVAACGGGSNETAEGNTSQGGSAESGSGSSETNRELGDVEVGSFSGSLEDCMALSVSVASIGLLGVAETFGDATGLTGADIDEAEQALSEMEAKIPAELESQFNTIRDAYANGVSFDDPDVDAAFDDISTFLEAECSDLGLSDISGLGDLGF